jgi:hypothetical protein
LVQAFSEALNDDRKLEAQRIDPEGKMGMIKERFHQVFDAPRKEDAEISMAEIYQWSFDAKAYCIWRWIMNIREDLRFWNFFSFRFTSGVIEGINRAIKGLKWQAYGYKDMVYFALKIMQKLGYLNHRYGLKFIYENETGLTT